MSNIKTPEEFEEVVNSRVAGMCERQALIHSMNMWMGYAKVMFDAHMDTLRRYAVLVDTANEPKRN